MTPQISIDQFIKFAQAKNINKPCSRCGGKSWEIFKEPPEQVWSIVSSNIDDEKEGNEGKFIPVMAMCCSNCGNMSFHASNIIQKWIDEEVRILSGEKKDGVDGA